MDEQNRNKGQAQKQQQNRTKRFTNNTEQKVEEKQQQV